MYGTKCCATLDAAEQCFHTRALVRACTIAAPMRPPCMRLYSLLNHGPKVPWMAQNEPFVLRECRTRLIAVLYVHTFFTCFGCLLTPYTHASPPPYAGSDPFETFCHGFGIPKWRKPYLGGAKRTVGDRDLTIVQFKMLCSGMAADRWCLGIHFCMVRNVVHLQMVQNRGFGPWASYGLAPGPLPHVKFGFLRFVRSTSLQNCPGWPKTDRWCSGNGANIVMLAPYSRTFSPILWVPFGLMHVPPLRTRVAIPLQPFAVSLTAHHSSQATLGARRRPLFRGF